MLRMLSLDASVNALISIDIHNYYECNIFIGLSITVLY